MALGNLSKKEWKAIYDLRTKAAASVDGVKALLEPQQFATKRAYEASLKAAVKDYEAAKAAAVALTALFAKAYEEQNDLYQEKVGESERWAESDRASQVESWLEALENLSSIEDLKENFEISSDDSVSRYVSAKGIDEYGDEYEDSEYESLPTHFPAKVETYVEVDAIADYLVDVERLDDSGASAF
jgi:hypothetical protein